MIDNPEIQLAIDEKQDEILTGMPVPREGKIGDIRTNVTHKGRFYQVMKTGIDTWHFSAPFSRVPSIHTMDDYLLKSGGTMISGAKIANLGTLDIVHTATEADDHALELDVDAAGFGDVKAIDITYTTGAVALGDDEGVILVNIDESLATGGDIFALEVLATEGSAGIYGLKAGALVGPVHQGSGSFVDMDSALVNATDRLTEFITSDPGGVNNVEIFSADNDTVTIGDAAKFEELEFLLETGASGAGIRPTFEFSTGVGAWTAFTPVDGTNGMRNTGIIAWDDSDIPTWAVGAGNEYLIRITRTRNSLSTVPVENKVQIAAVTEYSWDKDGDVSVRDISGRGLTLTGNIDLSGQTVDVTLNAAVDALNFHSNLLSLDVTNKRIGINEAAPTATLHAVNTEDNANVTIFNLEGKRPTPTNNDTMYIYYRMYNNAPASFEYARTTITAEDITAGSEEGSLLFEVARGGALDTVLKMSATEIVVNEAGADRDFRIEGSGAANAFFVQGSDGKVGIGTATPQKNLSVTTSGNDMIYIGEAGIATGKVLALGYYITADYGYIQAAHWGTGWKDIAINPSGGNVGIGTTTPQRSLSITTSGDSDAIFLGEAGSATGKVLALGYYITGDYGRIQAAHLGTGLKDIAINPSGGNIGLGAVALAGAKATVEGSIKMKEQAAAGADTAAYGQLWVKNTTPCELWFTDDAGTDTKIV